MDTHTILQIIEIIFAVAAFGYGVYEHYKRQHIEKVLKTITRSQPGDVAKIAQSCRWAWLNVKYAHEAAVKIPDSEEKRQLLKHLALATGDTAAGERLCISLFNQLLTFQKAQFDTIIITHPESKELELCIKENNNSN